MHKRGLVLKILFISFFAVAGVTLLLFAHAAVTDSSIEPENGTLSSSATIGSDVTASNGSYVAFGPGVSSNTFSIAVSGKTLVDAQGATVRLHGVNKSGSEYMCPSGNTFDGPSDQASVNALLSWHVNVVRVPLNEQCWLGINGLPSGLSAAQYQQAITNYVSLLTTNKIYTILEVHWTAPGTSKSLAQNPMPDSDHAPAFWTSVASTFKANPAVIFDLFNEPYPDNNADTPAAWTCLKNGGTCANVSYPVAGMQTLVDTVRTTGASNVIMTAGIQYAGNAQQWNTYKPIDPLNQLAASWHNYSTYGVCTTQSCWGATYAGVGNVPLIVGELGEGDCLSSYVTNFMNWADTKGLSYLGWAWNTYDCSTFPSLISNFDGTPTAFGLGFKQHYTQQFP